MQPFTIVTALSLLSAAVSAVAVDAIFADKTLWDSIFADHPERFDKLVHGFAKALNADTQGHITPAGFKSSYDAAKNIRLVPNGVDVTKYFNQVDLNADGVVTTDEVEQYLRRTLQTTSKSGLKARQEELESGNGDDFEPLTLIKRVLVRSIWLKAILISCLL